MNYTIDYPKKKQQLEYMSEADDIREMESLPCVEGELTFTQGII